MVDAPASFAQHVAMQRYSFWRLFAVAVLMLMEVARADDEPANALQPINAAIDEPLAPFDPPPTSDEVSAQILRLSDADFAVREAATRWLIQAGAAAPPVIHANAESLDVEAMTRVVHVLARLYTSRRSDVALAAGEVLEAMLQSEQPSLRQRAQRVLSTRSDLRLTRAVQAIETLGGIVRNTQAGQDRRARFLPPGAMGDVHRLSPDAVFLTKRWTGGDEQLKLIERLPDVRAVYHTKGAKVSREALADLQAAMPNLSIQVRGGRLGVTSLRTINADDSCIVGDVDENSAAERAGLRPYDVVIRCGDVPVRRFSDLIETLLDTEAGDKIVLHIVRNGQEMDVSVTLADWE